MRIGIDGGCLANRRGFGRFARQTLRALAESHSDHEFVVIVDRPSMDQIVVPDRCEIVPVDVRRAPSRAASASGRRSISDLFAMGRATAKQKLDLLYFPASYTFFPVWNVGQVIVTMHDTLALAHPELVFPSWKGQLAWAAKEHAVVRWSDRIATVSQSARRDLIAWFKLHETQVFVVPEAPDAVFRPFENHAKAKEILQSYHIDLSKRFVLYVGGLSPHKNLLRLIEAFAKTDESINLVLVGDMGDVFHTHVPELRAAVTRFGVEQRVIFTGYVPDEELAALYTRAYALVQPSLMEGFGLPPVEAMACGTPVISSRSGSLPEVVGEAGVFFDATDTDSMSLALQEFLADEAFRDELAAKALKRASEFTWSAAAQALLKAFEDLAAQKRARRIA